MEEPKQEKTGMVYTTLEKLKKASACKNRYTHLVQALGNEYTDNTPIDLVTILETNGLDDVLWIPRSAIDGDNIDIRYRLFFVACCQDVLHLMSDHRSRDAVKVAHLFAHGEVAQDELAAALAAAKEAAAVAVCTAAASGAGAAAALAATLAADENVVRAVARAAAGAASWAAAAAGVGAAARDAARTAAWYAARKNQSVHFSAIFSA